MVAETETPAERELERLIDRWVTPMSWRPDYESWREKRLWQERYQGERLKLIETFGGELAGRRILEISCGMGGTLVALAQAGADPVATEFNREYCAIAQRRGERHGLNLPILNAVGERIPFADDSFDLAICWDIVEHVQDPLAMLRELRRVVRPGGRVLLTIINRWAWRDPHYHIRGLNLLPRPLADRLVRRRAATKQEMGLQDRQLLSEMHYYTMRSFRRLARQAGFSVADMEALAITRGGKRRAGGLKGRLRDLAYRLRLGLPAYYLYRDMAKGTYELVLW
ncbi:MAG TPA: methyltransferase domain-containing protein [Herpetosiphonaceae bacterium]